MLEMLGGALRLERRTDHCVVFSATPQSAIACHEAEMKNVAIVSPYPYYELTTSDMTVRDFDSIGIRRNNDLLS
jgi:beta-phosphoglucomutase-like phosphatase (HAD superfamily)